MTSKEATNDQHTESGCFEKCTFPLGYIRQPIYACKTCLENSDDTSSEPAGICHSCSIACHGSHELFELFPKRHFRCDCGLPGKLNNECCTLMIPAKKILKKNDKNQYNHNFEGRYCRCDNNYDPGKYEHTMYQCITCEDWFHQNCIGNIPESIDDFDCYVCRECTKKYPFLLNGKDNRFSFGLSAGNDTITSWILSKDNTTVTTTNNDGLINGKRKASDHINTVNKKQRLENVCKRVDISSLPKHDNIEIFLQESWREGLCRCPECINNYKSHNIEYLLEEEKTYEPVEEEEQEESSFLQIGLEQLQSLDRVKVIESLKLYKSFANDIKSYLESFESSGKVLTQQDINDFFALKRQGKEP